MNKLLKGVGIVVGIIGGGLVLSEFTYMCGQCQAIYELRKLCPDEIGELMEYWNDDKVIDTSTISKYGRTKLKVMRYVLNSVE